jgi:thiol-disulfide isomerase/thioredoxin
VNRSRLVVLLLVAAALVSSLAYGLRQGSGGGSTPKAVDLASYRAAAGLAACPQGISPELPDLTLPCLGGGPDVRLRGTPSGVPTLVNVYGSWCGPCQEEMPHLAAFAQRAGGRVALVGVDTADDPRLALVFAKDVGQRWPAVVDDDRAVLRRYASGPPVTLFVTGAGKVVHVKAGPYRSVAALQADVRSYLGVAL